MAEINKTYDVAIIGAGPAGSTLAYFLVQSGARVILIDKEKFPRKKVCAGGLPPKVLDILPFDISSVIEREISQVTLTHKFGGEFTRSYHKPLIYTINRERFDNFLAQKAKSLGVEFLESQKIVTLSFESGSWILATTHKIIKATILVGADGANSLVAKKISLNPPDIFHTGLQVEIPIRLIRKTKYLDRAIALDWGVFKDSYGWIFPKGEMVSIGVKGPVNLGKQLKLYFYDLLRYYGISSENQNLSGHLIPHRISEHPILAKTALLVGDAAGLVDFWTGEGIFYAIKSSEIAAKHIKRFLDGQQASLDSYEIAVNQEIMPEIKTSYQFSKIFNYLSPLAFKIIRKYDYPWDVFCRIMRGDRTFLEVKKRFRPDILLKKLFLKSRRGSFE
jgi:geranylgeranyl reductase family protein